MTTTWTQYGDRVRAARHAAGIHELQQLAHQAGIPVSTLSNIERGVSEPKISQARKIAVACGITLCDLFPEDYEAAA